MSYDDDDDAIHRANASRRDVPEHLIVDPIKFEDEASYVEARRRTIDLYGSVATSIPRLRAAKEKWASKAILVAGPSEDSQWVLKHMLAKPQTCPVIVIAEEKKPKMSHADLVDALLRMNPIAPIGEDHD